MTKNINRIYLPIIFALLFATKFVSAIEVNLGLGNNPSAADYVSFIFGYAVTIAGVISLISFVIGAIGLISPNVESHSNAKDRMKGAIMGLLLTVASFLIIQTINPKLATPSLTPLPNGPGVYYTDGTKKAPAPTQEADLVSAQATIDQLDQLVYTCSPAQTSAGSAILVYEFDGPDFSAFNQVERVTCNSTTNSLIGMGSFQWEVEMPGIYLCMGGCSGSMCSGLMSAPIVSSQYEISSAFKGNVEGVRIVNSPNSRFGIILHQDAGLKGGFCNTRIISTAAVSCTAVPFPEYSGAADVFHLDETHSSDGVTFYSEPFGWDSGSYASYFEEPDAEINYPYNGPADHIVFNNSNPSQEDGYETRCPDFQKCPGSIYINGNYIVGLYSKYSISTNPQWYCQTFTIDVNNLKAEPILPASGGTVDQVFIIPTTGG